MFMEKSLYYIDNAEVQLYHNGMLTIPKIQFS
jgi:hypothetical protein